MQKLILIKLGGSVITDKTKEFTAREDNISRFAIEIKSALKNFGGKIIVGHGGGSFPHTPATKYKTKQGITGKESVFGVSLVEDAARQLNMIITKSFIYKSLPVFTFSPSSWLITDTEVVVKSYLDPIKKALQINILPVVYGDVVLDKSQGCTIASTEKLFSELAKKLSSEYKIRMIFVTNTDGVYDNNKKTIPVISSKNFTFIKKGIVGSKGIDVTGGMLHKVEEALQIAKKYKIETLIINGNKKGNLKKAILGEKVLGTRICN